VKPDEYEAACSALGWKPVEAARALGVARRTPFRYVNGEVVMPEPTARLLRAYVLLHMTMSKRKFHEFLTQITGETYK
jgi:hypothetical protein